MTNLVIRAKFKKSQFVRINSIIKQAKLLRYKDKMINVLLHKPHNYF